MVQYPLTLDGLRVLDTIARRGSFAAAADELHRVTSAVSYTVQKLEEDLGVVLFDRSGHRARLTVAGSLLVQRGRELLYAANQLVEDARAAACGWEQRLTIAIDAVFPEASLLPVVERFYTHQATNAAANTDIRIIAEVLGGPWDALESGRAEIAIAAAQPHLAKGLRSRPLCSTAFLYVAAPFHPIFSADPATLVLEDYRAIAIADSSRQKPTRSVRLGRHQATLTVGNFSAKIAALEAGLGIGTVPLHLLQQQLQAGTLRALPLPEPMIQSEVVLAWQTEPDGRAKQWFLQAIAEHFATLNAADTMPPAAIEPAAKALKQS